MKICLILDEKIRTKKISSKRLQDLEEYFKDNHMDKKYLLDSLRGIAGV
jgi:hypothetical protein